MAQSLAEHVAESVTGEQIEGLVRKGIQDVVSGYDVKRLVEEEVKKRVYEEVRKQIDLDVTVEKIAEATKDRLEGLLEPCVKDAIGKLSEALAKAR